LFKWFCICDVIDYTIHKFSLDYIMNDDFSKEVEKLFINLKKR